MRVFIRHSHKERKNDSTSKYGLDCGLSLFGNWTAETQFRALLKECLPNAIVVSPYYRARQTANVAQLTIKEMTGIIVPIYVDWKLGEYLAQEKYSLEDIRKRELLRPATLLYEPILLENKAQHRQRMKTLLGEVADTMGFTLNYLVTLNAAKATNAETVQLFSSTSDRVENNSTSNTSNPSNPLSRSASFVNEEFQPSQPEIVELFSPKVWQKNSIKSTDNVWYVTHGLNIWWLSRMLGLGKYYPNELCGLIVQSNGQASQLKHALD